MDTRALLDSLDLGVVAIAPDWTVAEWSSAAVAMTGLSADRVLRHEVWEALPHARGAEMERVLRQVVADGRPRTASLATGAATFEARVTRGPANHLLVVLHQAGRPLAPDPRASDLVEAFEAERNLYLRLFQSLPTPTFLLGTDGVIMDANGEGARLVGEDNARALRGQNLSTWVVGMQRAHLAVGLRDAAGRRQELEVAFEVPGDGPRHVKAIVVNLAPADQTPALLFLAIDVSRELLLQRRLLQADRLSQLGALVSGVAHELNNPLAAIAAFAEMLAADGRDPDLRESAGIIHAEALRAGRIVRTLLDFARQRPRVPASMDLADVAEQVLALQRSALKKARVRAAVAIPDGLPPVIGDAQELQQVLLNAVVNARQSIAASGRPGQILIVAQRSDDHVLVAIEDSGPGVPAELLERVFEPFFTTKGDEGTGLGLAISFGLVRAMGGRMWMQNVDGSGARLVIELPLDTTRGPLTTEVPLAPTGRHLTVLVVDDEDNVRRGMVLLARRLGHEVASVERFAEAAEQLSGVQGERFDALLVDVHLDDAHTGFELYERLRMEGRGRERRIVFTTGDSISARTRDELQRSERPVLRKPFSLQELAEVLERVAGS